MDLTISSIRIFFCSSITNPTHAYYIQTRFISSAAACHHKTTLRNNCVHYLVLCLKQAPRRINALIYNSNTADS